nr:uncharacterized protein LOC131783879 [Pocillopora verrucosa]
MTVTPSVPPPTGPWWEPLAKHDGDGNEDIKSKNNSSAHGTRFHKAHNKVKVDGHEFNCDHFISRNDHGTWCGCAFLGCTGSHNCQDGSWHCFIKNKNYDYRRITTGQTGDCDCHHEYNKHG